MARVDRGEEPSVGDVRDPRLLRAEPRHKLFEPTTMQCGAQRLRVHLLDVSATGALVHHAAPPPIGALVLIDCCGARRSARVMRAEGSRFGVQFTIPLTGGQIASLVESA